MSRGTWVPGTPSVVHTGRKAALLAAFSWLCCAELAAAEGPRRVTAALDWRRSAEAESCLDEAALTTGVETRLHRSVFGPRARADVIVEVQLERRPRGEWRAGIELRSGKGQLVGTRELATRAEHCSALDESLILAIALMVDISAEELPEAVKQPEPVVPRPVPRRSRIEVPRRTHAPREPWHFRTAVLGTAGVGVLPAFSPGVRLSFEAELPMFWRSQLDATWWLEQPDSGAGSGASFELASLGLYLCPIELGTETTRAAFCFGQEVGRLTASGFGFDRNDQRARLSYDLGLRSRVSRRLLGRVVAVAGVEALIPLSRDRFVADEADGARREVFRRPFIGAAAELGIGLDFP